MYNTDKVLSNVQNADAALIKNIIEHIDEFNGLFSQTTGSELYIDTEEPIELPEMDGPWYSYALRVRNENNDDAIMHCLDSDQLEILVNGLHMYQNNLNKN